MNFLFVETEKCLGCKSCELACAVKHSGSHSLYSIVNEPVFPCIYVEETAFGPFPVRCRHCVDPPCVDACITGALKQDKSKGIIYSDENRCIGCFMCIMVCPFGAIMTNNDKKIAYKCDLCKDEKEPVCVSNCPTGALVYYEPKELVRNKRFQRVRNAKK